MSGPDGPDPDNSAGICLLICFCQSARTAEAFSHNGGYMFKLYKCQAAFVFCAVLNAQDFRATITGKVTDASARSVANATVKTVNVATGDGSETKTNSEGF